MSPQLIISTDLDGTLLDHHTYSWASAEPALTLCRERDIPVIINTSKTASESLALQTTLGLSSPLIVENGSALLMNAGCLLKTNAGLPVAIKGAHTTIEFGTPRCKILKFLRECREQYNWKFEGFNDWNVKEIAEHTGLSLSDASRAAEKQYSEPLVWQDSESNLAEFKLHAVQTGLSLTLGGRFLHLQGQNNKATPLHWLTRNTRQWLSSQCSSAQAKLICLGDGQNDCAMLEAADYPVCVRSPVGEFPKLSTSKPVIYTDELGPAGWNKAVTTILNQYHN